MEALERAKLALREYLLLNKEKVTADLEDMRKHSEGNDIFSYITNLEIALSLTDFTYNPQCFVQNVTSSILPQAEIQLSPPEYIVVERNKKDSEIKSESFFLIILHYDTSSPSRIFI